MELPLRCLMRARTHDARAHTPQDAQVLLALEQLRLKTSDIEKYTYLQTMQVRGTSYLQCHAQACGMSFSTGGEQAGRAVHGSRYSCASIPAAAPLPLTWSALPLCYSPTYATAALDAPPPPPPPPLLLCRT
jgi:hypothetical protein